MIIFARARKESSSIALPPEKEAFHEETFSRTMTVTFSEAIFLLRATISMRKLLSTKKVFPLSPILKCHILTGFRNCPVDRAEWTSQSKSAQKEPFLSVSFLNGAPFFSLSVCLRSPCCIHLEYSFPFRSSSLVIAVPSGDLPKGTLFVLSSLDMWKAGWLRYALRNLRC